MTHTCHAPGCSRIVQPSLLACLPHWTALPRNLQAAIWKTYRPGQESDKNPSPLYLVVQLRCRMFWASLEDQDLTDLSNGLRVRLTEVLTPQLDDAHREPVLGEIRTASIPHLLTLVDSCVIAEITKLQARAPRESSPWRARR